MVADYIFHGPAGLEHQNVTQVKSKSNGENLLN
jgi:hypothetical protein